MIKEFKAMKFRVRDAEQSRELQEVLFSIGARWRDQKLCVVQYVDEPYICVNTCGSIYWASSNWDFRNDDKYEEQDTKEFIAQHKKQHKGVSVNKHKHYDTMMQYYADMNQIVEFRPDSNSRWCMVDTPQWYDDYEYRIKPAAPVEMWKWAVEDNNGNHFVTSHFTEEQIQDVVRAEGHVWFVKLEPTHIVKE